MCVVTFKMNSENATLPLTENNELLDKTPVKLYKRRWLMLGLFLLFGIINTVQSPQYSVVANIMVSYYGVSNLVIALSNMVFMASYVIFCFPGLYILEKLGIRKTLIIGIVGNSVGAWMKVIAVKSTLYWLALIGQTLEALCPVFVLPIPPKIAAVWFGDKEVATACSVGVEGAQVGLALGFLITPLLIHSGTNEVIAEGLYLSTGTSAVFSTLIGIAIYFFFEEFPPKPPSLSQLQAVESRIMTKSTFRNTTKTLITNKSFVLFLLVFGVNIGIQVPYCVFVNQITLHYYPNISTSEVGSIAFIIMLFVIIGVLSGGVILDKFKNYRLLTFLAFALNVCVFLFFCVCFGHALWLFKISAATFGFAVGCVFAVGFEICVELTYPESEEISGGFLACSYQIFGVGFSYLYYVLSQSVGFTYANCIIFAVVFITDILLFFVNFNLRRQNIVYSDKYVPL